MREREKRIRISNEKIVSETEVSEERTTSTCE